MAQLFVLHWDGIKNKGGWFSHGIVSNMFSCLHPMKWETSIDGWICICRNKRSITMQMLVYCWHYHWAKEIKRKISRYGRKHSTELQTYKLQLNSIYSEWGCYNTYFWNKNNGSENYLTWLTLLHWKNVFIDPINETMSTLLYCNCKREMG